MAHGAGKILIIFIGAEFGGHHTELRRDRVSELFFYRYSTTGWSKVKEMKISMKYIVYSI